jgi:hypothetical protein
VVLPKSTTNISTYKYLPADDGSILGVTALPEGSDIAYTTFNGTPTSGSHTWTDDATSIPSINLLVDKIDIGTSGGGGMPILGGSVVR